ncbi:ABC transporter permease [Yinghuangia aomiensis]|uniref:ABC transporter permease n=1 Tax=Yinghuangia aomiensis TaxID=676205 RepID=A0ABP9H1R2_9ACTN
MLLFTVRRVLSGLFLLFVISFLAYLLLSVQDIDVGQQVLGMGARPDQIDAKNAQLGLDRPMPAQYFDWLGHALRGDLGTSWYTGEDINQTVSTRLPVTLSLMVGVTLVSGVVSFLAGTWAGLRQGGIVDKGIQFLGVLGYSVPGFLLTLLLVQIFAVQLKWFPAIGYTPFAESPGGWLSTITLPVIALSTGAVAGVSQQVRGAVADVLRQDYVRTLRARGLPPHRVVLEHVLRNASAPALSVLGMQFVGLIGGTVLVEQIFALPGIGSMAVTYTARGDVPAIMAVVMVSVIGVVLINLLVDLAIGWLNPKARAAA